MTDHNESSVRTLSEAELLWVSGGMNKSELIDSIATESGLADANEDNDCD